MLREFRRVLTPHGKVVISTHHPAHDWQLHSPNNFFRDEASERDLGEGERSVRG